MVGWYTNRWVGSRIVNKPIDHTLNSSLQETGLQFKHDPSVSKHARFPKIRASTQSAHLVSASDGILTKHLHVVCKMSRTRTASAKPSASTVEISQLVGRVLKMVTSFFPPSWLWHGINLCKWPPEPLPQSVIPRSY
ncbi:hypothetical protein BaRGS_00015363 [Batillaria attramentaria]|uniref:Uncharacterized protein n=1 Tax=Batillaria attramentaria TaxID=370345 RepID=A0ABD0L1Q2_9CAEN